MAVSSPSHFLKVLLLLIISFSVFNILLIYRGTQIQELNEKVIEFEDKMKQLQLEIHFKDEHLVKQFQFFDKTISELLNNDGIINKNEEMSKNNTLQREEWDQQNIDLLTLQKQINETALAYHELQNKTNQLISLNPTNFMEIAIKASHHRNLSLLLNTAVKSGHFKLPFNSGHAIDSDQFYKNQPMRNDYDEKLKYLQIIHNDLERMIYPFLKISSNELSQNFTKEKRGIAICVGKNYVKMAEHAMRVIRQIHGCNLKIEIFCYNRNEIPEMTKLRFEEIGNVEFRYIDDYVDKNAELVSFAIKPFAILFSRFEEVLLMDADSIFLQNPELLFDDPNYQKTGALFFRDRVVDPKNKRRFLESSIPKMSNFLKNTLYYKGLTSHLIESGVVVYHKIQHLHSILLSSKLNCKFQRSVLWKESYGDKEAFWLAMEMIGDYAYSLNPHPAGVIGSQLSTTPDLCGNLFHVNHKKEPLWWNGGIFFDKKKSSDLLKIQVWSLEDSLFSKWFNNLNCYHNPLHVHDFSYSESEIIDQIFDVWRKLSAI